MAGERDLSCRVLVIPEDPTHNGDILSPLVSRLLRECGKANARVTVLPNPKVSGFEHACGAMPTIVERYKHFDLLLFLPDADGKHRSRLDVFAGLESKLGPKLICCAAVEEVEAWLLAGHVAKLGRPWSEIRADVSVKENVFIPFLRERGNPRQPGGGREILMQETLANYRGLLERCPELAELQRRVCEALDQSV
jgi:hypothetical protein